MGGLISNSFSNSPSGTSREFIKITIDGKVIKGNSAVDKCNDYFDGDSPHAFHAFAGIDGTFFDLVTLRLKVTKEIQSILENFFKRGGKKVTIEILRRESTEVSSAYASYSIIYDGCRIHDIILKHEHDTNLALEMSFTPEESVSIELNIPSDDGNKTDKIGPIKYSLKQGILI
ncbi:TPA: type VI secretion protein [Salmonella enterica]|uniref:type VI secretion protein n=1 Tax=Salmonella enterica TaxID=28901 RepID=UPI00126CB3FF|nr:type VI secretion protein [Salmonella enterica]EDA3267903.1 type VI secretion protein [Salmonella enterica subsp. enterica serovar Bovismorbificans]EIU5772666.1 type VI secretion protein [Salmonella enterica]NYA57981.1 type VI secretion protein [Salmonella enterica]HCL5275394.1 type VI secretion protein [Salmonella enterica]